MKKFSIALAAVFVLAIACGGAGTPDQVVQKLFDGVQSADGDAIVSCLSAETVAGINETLEELKANPESTAAIVAIAAMNNIVITPEEVADLTAGRFISLQMSPAGMPDFSTVEIGAAVVDGETATVPVTMDGDTKDIELILEDGKWKIGGGGMLFM